ncbi:Oxidoreductase, short chain dehydrogenase/reductase family protein [Aphelenchoides bicaudatus]|nr:Oxidoreductase, short chain dehydrogenase/reductase family protein [Aphelenchoides bicaudatus]
MSKDAAVAIITGASSGIGKAAALEFAKHKYSLSLSGRDEKSLLASLQECEKAGAPKVIVTIGDLREEKNAKELIEHTLKEFGKINCLVNAAGILVNGTVLETSLTEYDKQFDVNVRSVIQLTRLAIPLLTKSKGTIVNVSSVTGPCAFPGVTYYCMSKAALDQFTKCLALELASTGVRVNSVNPGVIVTNVHTRAGMDDKTYKEFLERGKQTHALGRVGRSEEVAKSIYFLGSEDSSFTTGQMLFVDGGRNLMHPR